MYQVELFDEEHEKDLEKVVNHFLQSLDEKDVINIRYNVAIAQDVEGPGHVYCYSAMVVYRV